MPFKNELKDTSNRSDDIQMVSECCPTSYLAYGSVTQVCDVRVSIGANSNRNGA